MKLFFFIIVDFRSEIIRQMSMLLLAMPLNSNQTAWVFMANK